MIFSRRQKVANKEREQLWQQRVAQWQSSGLSQREYAVKEGSPVRQVGYWVRRLTEAQDARVRQFKADFRRSPSVHSIRIKYLGSNFRQFCKIFVMARFSFFVCY